jgi:hypothetical protein
VAEGIVWSFSPWMNGCAARWPSRSLATTRRAFFFLTSDLSGV